jgi:hypothetical protein
MQFVAAHGEWKLALKRSLEKQVPHVTSQEACNDRACGFGRYYEELPEQDRESERGLEVHQKHGEFHREAAHVVELMEAQRWREAYAAIAPGSAFERSSRDLTRLMLAWQQELAPKA